MNLQIYEGNILSKPCGIGSVGFPNFALCRYQQSGFPLCETCTESPLRPHYNPQNIFIRNSLEDFLNNIGKFYLYFAHRISKAT